MTKERELLERDLAAFIDMREALSSGARSELSSKQRAWIKKATGVEDYKNLYSSGKVPRGREVPLPPALQNLPLKPPGRR